MQLLEGQLATATVVWHELLFGLYRLPRGKRRSTLERYLFEVVQPSLPMLPYDADAATWHAEERVRLVDQGSTPAFVDGQIAAIAATSGLRLVTRNVRDYQRFEGVRVESWHS
jgi:tRNA(fMet)-specific endonuclease VapC